MGDTPSRTDVRLGPYHLGNRSWYLGRHLGHLLTLAFDQLTATLGNLRS